MNEKFMKIALKEAEKGLIEDEVPIGAVIVLNGKIISKAHNIRQKTKCSLDHAEMLAIKKACKKVDDWRLENAEMYVTLEPCPMCLGAILNARIEKVFFGAYDTNSNQNLTELILNDKRLNHKTAVVGGILENDCKNLLQKFFKSKR